MAITRDLSTTFNYGRFASTDGFVLGNAALSVACPGSRVCQNVPGYREIIRQGGDATGPYSLNSSRCESSHPGSWSMTWKNVDNSGVAHPEIARGFATSLSIPPVNVSTSAAKAEAIALTKIYSKIRSEQEHLNTLASLAEFGDVVRQFGSPFAALVDLSNKRLNRLELERRGLKGSIAFKRAKWLKIVASTWLEYAFGLAPLISDTRKVAEAYAHFQNDVELSSLTQRSRISSRGEDESKSSSSTVTNIFGGQIWFRRLSLDSYQSRCQYTVGLNASLGTDFGSNTRLLQLLGINQANLIGAAWEALPWSWLVDYFSNVGNILNAASTSTSNVSWVSKTSVSKSTRYTADAIDEVKTKEMLANNSRKAMSISNDTATAKFVRTVLVRGKGALTCPPLYLEVPSQIGQLANMASVLLSRKEKTSALWLF